MPWYRTVRPVLDRSFPLKTGMFVLLVGVLLFVLPAGADATVCEDGWVSGSSGPGTCSWHGGIKGNDGNSGYGGRSGSDGDSWVVGPGDWSPGSSQPDYTGWIWAVVSLVIIAGRIAFVRRRHGELQTYESQLASARTLADLCSLLETPPWRRGGGYNPKEHLSRCASAAADSFTRLFEHGRASVRCLDALRRTNADVGVALEKLATHDLVRLLEAAALEGNYDVQPLIIAALTQRSRVDVLAVLPYMRGKAMPKLMSAALGLSLDELLVLLKDPAVSTDAREQWALIAARQGGVASIKGVVTKELLVTIASDSGLTVSDFHALATEPSCKRALLRNQATPGAVLSNLIRSPDEAHDAITNPAFPKEFYHLLVDCSLWQERITVLRFPDLDGALLDRLCNDRSRKVAEAAKAYKQRGGPQRRGGRCSRCGGTMVVRENRATGSSFWGCSRYPKCRNTSPC